jgi:hypothetical protein
MINIFVSLAAILAVLVGQTSTPTRATYVTNLYIPHSVRFQNPDETACTADSTLIMLNLIATSGQASARTPRPRRHSRGRRR